MIPVSSLNIGQQVWFGDREWESPEDDMIERIIDGKKWWTFKPKEIVRTMYVLDVLALSVAFNQGCWKDRNDEPESFAILQVSGLGVAESKHGTLKKGDQVHYYPKSQPQEAAKYFLTYQEALRACNAPLAKDEFCE